MVEGVGRLVSGGEDLDVETLKERARTKLGCAELPRDLVVDRLRGRTGELHAHAEDLAQLVVDPDPGWRAAEQIVMLAKQLPDLTRVSFTVAIARRHAEGLDRHAARVEHAEDVMVRLDE